ncbi:MAG TPA: general secretion pathway protein GspB [Burkholderiaceae bacterium]|nr:general secretion pathway protein GspB [Burkholderiaceae bacterium]
MSYILDALRRADLERERGAVPGLNAQPAALPAFSPEASRSARPWVWALVGALVVVLAALAWYAFGRGAPSPPAPPTLAANPATPPGAAPSPTSPLPTPASSTSAAAPSVASPPMPRAPAALPERHATSPRKTARAPVRIDRKNGAEKRAEAPTVPATDPDAGASGGLVYARDQLPESIRSELPVLSIGGASYSKNPASRMLIINGQVFHEGDTLGPNLSLKQIQLKAAVLEYKGYRYKVSF